MGLISRVSHWESAQKCKRTGVEGAVGGAGRGAGDRGYGGLDTGFSAYNIYYVKSVGYLAPLISGKPDRLEGLTHLRCKSFKGWAGFDSHPQNPRTACMGKETEPFEMYLKGCNSGKGREDLGNLDNLRRGDFPQKLQRQMDTLGRHPAGSAG